MPDGDSMWSQKGATMSDKSARQEFGLTQEEIIAAIRAGKLQFRESNMHGNPWYRLLRHEVESLVRGMWGLDHLHKKKLQKELGIRPLFVRLPEQVLGLTRLVLLAWRVLTLVEIVLRARLAERGEQLEGLYEGQKTRKEGRPTAKRMLRAVAGLEMTLTVVQVGEQRWWHLPPLP